MERTKFELAEVIDEKIKAIQKAQNQANEAAISSPGCKLSIEVERNEETKVIEFGAADEEARIAICNALEQLYQQRLELETAFNEL